MTYVLLLTFLKLIQSFLYVMIKYKNTKFMLKFLLYCIENQTRRTYLQNSFMYVEVELWDSLQAPGKTTPQKTVADGPFLYYKMCGLGYSVRADHLPHVGYSVRTPHIISLVRTPHGVFRPHPTYYSLISLVRTPHGVFRPHPTWGIPSAPHKL